MIVHQNSETSLFSKLPEKEVTYLIETTDKILSSSKTDTLEHILLKVSSVFSEKEYGWKEAILDGLWHRYPSEIKTMRFCSEEALKNYLLLRTIGIPTQYVLIEDWNNSGVAHETTFVYEANHKFIVDHLVPGDVLKIMNIEQNKLTFANGYTVPFFKIYYLTEEEVFARVKNLRSGTSFLDAINTGQELYNNIFPEGQLEAFVCTDDYNRKLTFSFIFTQAPLAPRFFFSSHYEITGQKAEGCGFDCGLIGDGFKLNITKLPILFSHGKYFMNILNEKLLEETAIKELEASVIYFLRGKEQPGENLTYWLPQDARLQVVRELSSNPKNKDAFDFYTELKGKCFPAAERYIDFVMSLRYMEDECVKTLLHSNKITSNALLAHVFAMIHLNDLVHLFSFEEWTTAQKKIISLFNEKMMLSMDFDPFQQLKEIFDNTKKMGVYLSSRE